MSTRDHPAMKGYELDNLLSHANTDDGRKFLEMHRSHITAHRDMAHQHAQALLEMVALADEILQRFAVVLDQGGEA